MNNPLEAIKASLVNPDVPFTLTVFIRLKSGAEAEFLAAAKLAEAGTRLEPGNIAYEFHQNASQPRQILLFEKWRSFADLERHFQLDHTRDILAKTAELGDGPPSIEAYTPLA